MVTNIISAVFIISGIIILLLEMVFSIKLFPFSGAAGFVIVFFGVYLLSAKITKQKSKIKKKDLGHFPGSGNYDGGDGG